MNFCVVGNTEIIQVGTCALVTISRLVGSEAKTTEGSPELDEEVAFGN
jgi:hypothetical protein